MFDSQQWGNIDVQIRYYCNSLYNWCTAASPHRSSKSQFVEQMSCLVLNDFGGKYKFQYLRLFGLFLGGGFQHFYFYPYLGKSSNLTNIFQMG